MGRGLLGVLQLLHPRWVENWECHCKEIQELVISRFQQHGDRDDSYKLRNSTRCCCNIVCEYLNDNIYQSTTQKERFFKSLKFIDTRKNEVTHGNHCSHVLLTAGNDLIGRQCKPIASLISKVRKVVVGREGKSNQYLFLQQQRRP